MYVVRLQRARGRSWSWSWSPGGALEAGNCAYDIQAVCGIPASLLGGLLVNTKQLGRKGTGTLAVYAQGSFYSSSHAQQ
jgi:hypothetical protein